MNVEWECLGCVKLENDEEIVMLRSGRIVCRTCRPARIESHAHAILALPDDMIVPALMDLADRTSRSYAEEVRALMVDLWKNRN